MPLYMGLMSGTSMDGIDAAIINTDTNIFIDGITRPYSPAARSFLDEVTEGKKQSLQHYCQLNTVLGKEFAQAALQLLQKCQYSAGEIVAIGSHGQTVCHNTQAEIPYTLQLACAHTIAQMTGITVVADFRSRDLVVGGQGAPFAPVYHQAIFKQVGFPIAIINIGGIANLTCLINENQVMGYDIGPGNCLMDGWINRHHNKSYDDNGAWAASGKIIPALLDALLNDPYFLMPAPKSLGKEYYSTDWLQKFSVNALPPADVQRTLLQLTAASIASGIRHAPGNIKRILLCGGGAQNGLLLQVLKDLLPDRTVETTQSVQVNPDYLEAMMFAWLAEKTLHNIPMDMRAITGARYPTILGAVYPASS